MKKILWSIVIVLLVLIVIAGVVGSFFLGDIVKRGVEIMGPQITKVSVDVDTVSLSLLTGSATIKGLVVGNPEGYETAQAISVGTVAVGVDPLSILSDKIVLRSIHVESPEITFEGGLGGNNLSKILDNVNATAQSGGPVSTTAATANHKPKPAKKIEVDDFVITGAKVHVSLNGLGGKEATVMLPDIHLTNLGKGGNGLTATDLTRRVLSAIVAATVKTVVNSTADISKGAEKLTQGAGKNVGDSVNKITKGIGNLFGK